MEESHSRCQICTMDAPFCAQLYYICISHSEKVFILIVVVVQLFFCTFIHESPWHNCITILRHSKYDILVTLPRFQRPSKLASMSHSLICIGCTQSEWMSTTSHCNHPWIVNECTNATNCTSFVASMLAPFPTNNCTISTWPLHAARSNGGPPYCPCTNTANTLLATKYHKTNKHCSLAYHSISHRLNKPYAPSRKTCFMLHCVCIPMFQTHPTP